MDSFINIITKIKSLRYISDIEPLTYGMLINNIDYDKKKKVKTEYSFLDLEKLVNEFRLDIPPFIEENIPEPNICEIGTIETPTNNTIGFISKKYYSDDYSYCY